MKPPLQKTIALLAIFIFLGATRLQAQREQFAMRPGQVILKTNPVMLFRPEPNLAVEVGLTERWSLEYRFTWFAAEGVLPDKRGSGSPWVFGGNGYSMHLQVRRFLKAKPSMFFSWGVMYKQWEYQGYEVVRLDNDQNVCYFENRKSFSAGARGLYGMRFPLAKGRLVFESYVGMTLRYRYDEGNRTLSNACTWGFLYVGPFGQKTFLPGLNGGINLGLNLGRRGAASAE
jgi:hypothetical protein